MLAKTHSYTIMGVQAYPIVIEVDCANGLPSFNMVGLLGSSVKEARDRVFSALTNSDFTIPHKKTTINLAPAYIRKEGSVFDISIAIGILVASQQIKVPLDILQSTIFLGELSLDGSIKPVQGCLSAALSCFKDKVKQLFIPYDNYPEVQVVKNITIYPVKNLNQVIDILHNKTVKITFPKITPPIQDKKIIDFSDVKGQYLAKRACEVLAAGGHNFLFIGSPGCGKSMLAKRIPTILPNMMMEEKLETTMIYSVAKELNQGLIETRPFRSPHHNISQSALVGGGSFPRPGEISLAHNGILFLDELGEFKRNTLEILRQPLEDGKVRISRALISLEFPSRTIFGSAMNPCPCGYLLDNHHNCNCRPIEIKKYLGKISGPLLDRIDLQIEIPTVSDEEMIQSTKGESSDSIKNRVEKAREFQKSRFQNTNNYCNAHMSSQDIHTYCNLKKDTLIFFKEYLSKVKISARTYDRILKVSRTIADLEQSDDIKEQHIAEAIQYRGLDRTYQYLAKQNY